MKQLAPRTSAFSAVVSGPRKKVQPQQKNALFDNVAVLDTHSKLIRRRINGLGRACTAAHERKFFRRKIILPLAPRGRTPHLS